MTVLMTVAKTLGGAAAADSLEGGGTGVDIGSVLNGEYAPIISAGSNTGWQALYLSHNGVTDPISNVGTFIALYSQTYGGTSSAAADYTTLKNKGFGSGTSSNNSDGLSEGLRIEHDADLGVTLGLSAFDGTRAQVKIYGDGSGAPTDGIDIGSAFALHVDALIYNNAGSAVDAITPQTGKIGKSGDTILGDAALVKLRFYLTTGAGDGGRLQWDWCVKYSYVG